MKHGFIFALIWPTSIYPACLSNLFDNVIDFIKIISLQPAQYFVVQFFFLFFLMRKFRPSIIFRNTTNNWYTSQYQSQYIHTVCLNHENMNCAVKDILYRKPYLCWGQECIFALKINWIMKYKCLFGSANARAIRYTNHKLTSHKHKYEILYIR